MGCQSSSEPSLTGSSTFVPTSVSEIDQMYKTAELTYLNFHKDSGTMLVAIDTFQTATGGGKKSTAKAVLATLVAVMADLLESDYAIIPQTTFPGLSVADSALRHTEAQRAWHLWDSLAGELLIMITEIEAYFPQASDCAEIPKKVKTLVETLSKNDDIRVIDLRKLNTFIAMNNRALLDGAGEFHTAVYRIKSIISEAVIVIETLHMSKKMKKLQEISTAAMKQEIFDPLLVLEHFPVELAEFLDELPKI